MTTPNQHELVAAASDDLFNQALPQNVLKLARF